MLVNKVTGEWYQTNRVGANLILVSMSTGIQRTLLPTKETQRLFTSKPSVKQRSVKVRPEAEVVPDLVRSLQLELKFLERRSQKVFLRFR